MADPAEVISVEPSKDGMVLSYLPLRDGEMQALVKLLDVADPAKVSIPRVFAVPPATELSERIAEAGIRCRVSDARGGLVVQSDAAGIESVAKLLQAGSANHGSVRPDLEDLIQAFARANRPSERMTVSVDERLTGVGTVSLGAQPAEPPVESSHYRILVKDGRTRIERDLEVIKAGESEPSRVIHEAQVYDGTRSRRLQRVVRGEGRAFSGSEHAGDTVSPIIPMLVTHYAAPVWLEQLRKMDLSLEPGTREGQIVLRAERNAGVFYRFFIERDKGYHASRIETHTKTHGLNWVTQTTLAQKDGAWFPAERKTFQVGEDGKLQLSRETKISNLDRDADIDDDLFTMSFPNGARIWYDPPGEWRVIGENRGPTTAPAASAKARQAATAPATKEDVKPEKLMVAIEAKIAVVPTNVDRELCKQFPTSRELGPQLRVGDALSTEQATQLLQELAEKTGDSKRSVRVLVDDALTARIDFANSSDPVTIDGVEYDPPQRRLQVGVNVAEDCKHVAATVNANLKGFLAENGTHIEETVDTRGELTLEDRAWVLLRAPIQRERIALRETADSAKQPSALATDKYAYIILRATIIWPSDLESTSGSESAVEDPRSPDHTKSTPGFVYVVGEVERPGCYAKSVDAPLTLLRVIAAAEGLKKPASSKLMCRISRCQLGSKSMTRTFDLDAILENRAEDPELEHNDYVFISTKGQPTSEWKELPIDKAELPNNASSQPASIQPPQPTTGLFFIAGDVPRPGPYQLCEGLTLSRALVAAGGIEPTNRKGPILCRIKRREEKGIQHVIVIDDVEPVMSGERPDIEIRLHDLIRVEPKGAKKSDPGEQRTATREPAGPGQKPISTQPASRISS